MDPRAATLYWILFVALAILTACTLGALLFATPLTAAMYAAAPDMPIPGLTAALINSANVLNMQRLFVILGALAALVATWRLTVSRPRGRVILTVLLFLGGCLLGGLVLALNLPFMLGVNVIR